MQKKKHIQLIGSFDARTGIGWQSLSFLLSMHDDPNLHIEAIIPAFSISKQSIQFLKNYDIEITHLDRVNKKRKSDIAIYLESPCYHSLQKSSDFPLGKIKILYTVWESDYYWRNTIKTQCKIFDLILVPDVFVKETLQKSGANIDIIVLEPIILKPKIVKRKPRKRVTFGFISSNTGHKNMELVIQGFLGAFGNSKEADLRLHTSAIYNQKEMDEVVSKQKSLCKSYNNVYATHGFVDDIKFTEILNSIDCFISMASEGYSRIIRQFMYLGRPIIVNHTAAYENLPELTGLWFLESKIPYPAKYVGMYNKCCGNFYYPYVEDLILLLRETFGEIKQKKFYSDLADFAENFSVKRQRDSFMTVVNPSKIEHSPSSKILPNGTLNLTSQKAIKKYRLL